MIHQLIYTAADQKMPSYRHSHMDGVLPLHGRHRLIKTSGESTAAIFVSEDHSINQSIIRCGSLGCLRCPIRTDGRQHCPSPLTGELLTSSFTANFLLDEQSSSYNQSHVNSATKKSWGQGRGNTSSELCRLFNHHLGNMCRYAVCKFTHVCSLCRLGPHPASQCNRPQRALLGLPPISGDRASFCH